MPFPNRRPPGDHRLVCGCKINLYLHIHEKLPNGYHRLDSLILPLDEPSDTLKITLGAHGALRPLRVLCAAPGIDPDCNTLTKAYALYAEAAGFSPALTIRLEKGIPHGAGLGGGSSDAARLLLFLQELADTCGAAGLSEESLADLAARVGADVPFFLLRRPALAHGIGEILEPTSPPCPGMHLVLICPDLRISTPWAFSLLDAAREEEGENAQSVLTRDEARDTTPFAFGMRLTNDFEQVIFTTFPQLAKLRDDILRNGARVACLSGTGASLFGLFDTEKNALMAATRLRTAGLTVFTHAL